MPATGPVVVEGTKVITVMAGLVPDEGIIEVPLLIPVVYEGSPEGALVTITTRGLDPLAGRVVVPATRLVVVEGTKVTTVMAGLVPDAGMVEIPLVCPVV